MITYVALIKEKDINKISNQVYAQYKDRYSYTYVNNLVKNSKYLYILIRDNKTFSLLGLSSDKYMFNKKNTRIFSYKRFLAEVMLAEL